MTKLESANACIDAIRAKSDTAILMCSLGKDSLVVLDMIYPKFKKVYCYFMYFVKNLDHIDRWVRWTQARYPNIEFVQIPHWNLSYLLRSGLYCTPQPNIKLIKFADVCAALRLKHNCPYVFIGMKKADGMNRRLMLNGYAENNYENNGFVYPLAEWNQKDVLSYMKMHNMPEPVRYSLKASSGVGLNVDCFLWMRKYFPQDLEKIYQVLPFARRILFEYDEKERLEALKEQQNGTKNQSEN